MTEATTSQPLMRVHDLRVGFTKEAETTFVTHGISFEIGERETLALVGESGSGKSVTAMSILDLLPRTAVRKGSVRWGEEELIGVGPARLRQLRGGTIGVIFQEPMTAFNPVYTIGRQISDAILLHEKLSRRGALARAVELLREVGIPEPERRITSYPHQLSGGQRQRAMIAMAISGSPKLLIADEPTTALDVTVQAEILRLLRSLQESRGMSILLITHDMGVVAEMADRVVVMKDGLVVEAADVYSLFAAPQNAYTQRLLNAVPKPSLLTAEVREAAPDVEPATPPALVVDDLHIRYPGSWRKPGFLAVEGVSFAVPAGKVVGLVGESGSGKSTIGKAVVGLLPIESGRVEIAGTDVTSVAGAELRRARAAYGMVFQDPASSLNPRVSIGASIAEPLAVHRSELSAAERRRRVTDLLEQVELPAAWASRFPHELSGGQRQRVGIARALALEPKLLIADEPTSALDVSVQAAVLDIFQELQERLGFSCLFISHDLAVVELLSENVVVLQKGAIIEQGSARGVLTNPQMPYTRRLVAAAPVPDPVVQRQRRIA
ncbi:peptide/nickel transport system ATP-binding protein [Microbacterium keratanolyticum]|uniref:Oligopeptide ABC transporter, ATP-binding protein n=1 Tax=Microbacterium keratanolyticum TaxID=67574 RepID=A0A9W6M7X7_9MICO|nr:dipeptide ABC transporter ATP-binding protein [Microbacterium keratanolyticum]MBM7468860.1 peptide/nickel transport system ATP-binding protein [Microbacterium keratanolyticum]GLK00938.1 putative oligopeptide ABC transporter, ATP-binding protein [Microbacterium keratanolyticum]